MRNHLIKLGTAMCLIWLSQAAPAKRDIIGRLQGSAEDIENRFQPLLDFDTDGCLTTSAINAQGRTNPGLNATDTPEGQCNDITRLDNANVYSRKRCNNGICAVMYEHYFEKDQAIGGSFFGGHKHDWENIVVFIRGDDVIRVAPSCHGEYNGASNSFPLAANGKQVMAVYQKDSIITHCFRFATDDDITRPENPYKQFVASPLIGWNSWPTTDLRTKMLAAWKGEVGPKLDDEFTDSLRAAAGDEVSGFDPAVDG